VRLHRDGDDEHDQQTSITSISGVVFISTIMSSSDDPTLMAMVLPFSSWPAAR
jgi:hypothetical protein